MAVLCPHPGSSTAKQRQVLHQVKRRRGWSDAELHDAIGAESTTELSAAQASACIRRLGKMELANPPGEKPAPFAGNRKRTTATRMIAPDHEEHIERWLIEYFGNLASGLAWLEKDFSAKSPHDLLTARRAGTVLYVLKNMIARRERGDDV